MIKKSKRQEIEEILVYEIKDTPAIRARLAKIINMTKKYYKECHTIPKGHHPCRVCRATNFINFDEKNAPVDHLPPGLFIEITICGKCKGTGYLDWVSNSMSRPDDDAPYTDFVRLNILGKPLLESSAILFYSLFFKNAYLDQPLTFKFNRSSKRYVNRFARYFLSYKQERIARIRFIQKHFTIMRSDFLKLTKVSVSDLPRRKHICEGCKSQPFDLIHDIDFDTICVSICGKCYGSGFQTKRSTNALATYFFEIPDLNYHERKPDLRYILEVTSNMRDDFTMLTGGDPSKNIQLMDYNGKPVGIDWSQEKRVVRKASR